jgi:hypothetical protein
VLRQRIEGHASAVALAPAHPPSQPPVAEPATA